MFYIIINKCWTSHISDFVIEGSLSYIWHDVEMRMRTIQSYSHKFVTLSQKLLNMFFEKIFQSAWGNGKFTPL